MLEFDPTVANSLVPSGLDDHVLGPVVVDRRAGRSKTLVPTPVTLGLAVAGTDS
jgi:hypothetical protein